MMVLPRPLRPRNVADYVILLGMLINVVVIGFILYFFTF